MARKRMIDPNIWVSEDFSKLPYFARLVWIGLISNADDEGRGKANLAYIKSQVFPYDDSLTVTEIQDALNEIIKNMQIKIYEAEGKRYYQLLNWSKFQTINRPSPSQIPPYHENIIEKSVSTHGTLSDNSYLKELKLNGIEDNNKELVYNIFNEYSTAGACTRVREKTADERNIFEKFYKDFFDWCYLDRYREVAYEIIDTMIEALEQARSEEGLKFKGKVYNNAVFSSVLFKVDVDRFRSIIKQLVFNEGIKHRPVYILGCIITASESNDQTSQEELDRFLENMERTYENRKIKSM